MCNVSKCRYWISDVLYLIKEIDGEEGEFDHKDVEVSCYVYGDNVREQLVSMLRKKYNMEEVEQLMEQIDDDFNGIMERYTGIDDSHGKPIYEGDVVTIRNDGGSWAVEYDSLIDKFYIETMTPAIFFKKDDTCCIEYHLWRLYVDDFEDDIRTTIEVIDNIHEYKVLENKQEK